MSYSLSPRRRASALLVGVAIVATGVSAPVMAQENSGLEDIIVTAQKREESLQQTPIAITAMSAAALQKQGISGLEDMVKASPNIYFSPYPSSNTTLMLFMRGQGIGDPMIITQDGGVGLYVDGFYQSRPQNSAFDLADVERVEVLRGPQGTLYGRNTTGGAINIISKKPSGEFDLRGSLSVGNLGYQRALVNLDLPAVGQFKVKLTGLYSHRNGWQKNRNAPGNSESNDFQYDRKLAFRGAVRWEPTDDITVDYAGDYSNQLSTPVLYLSQSEFAPIYVPGYVFDVDKAWRSIYIPKSRIASDGQSLTAEWRASDAFTLRSLSSYRHVKMRGYQDYAEAFLAPFATYDLVTSKTYTQEFQAVGTVSPALRYVVGLYYFHEDARHFETVDVGLGPTRQTQKDRDTHASSTSYAAYGQATLAPDFANQQLELTLGARFTHDKREATRTYIANEYNGLVTPFVWRQFNAPGTLTTVTQNIGQTLVKSSKFSPAVTLSYMPTEELTLYGKLVTGYKAGGANEASPFFTRTYKPETVTSYEVGLKSEFLDRRLRVNLAGYIAKYKDLQITMTADATDQSLNDTFNAGNANVKGFEAEVTAMPFRGLTLSANYAYIHYKLRDVFAPAGSFFDPAINPHARTHVGEDISGYFGLPFTPKDSIRLSGDWEVGQVGPGQLAFHADYTWKGATYTTAGVGPLAVNRDFAQTPAFGLFDGRISYSIETDQGKKVTAALWAKNLFNKHYVNFGTGIGSVSDGYFTQALAYGMPRTFGLDIDFSF